MSMPPKHAKKLWSAAVNGDVSKVNELAKPTNVNVQYPLYLDATPLHAASFSKKPDPKIVSILLENGADINAVTKKNSTALHMAIQHKNFEICKVLVEKGADQNIKTAKGNTALHIAAKCSDVDILSVLLKKDASSLNAKNESRQTPLDVAQSKEGSKEVARFITQFIESKSRKERRQRKKTKRQTTANKELSAIQTTITDIQEEVDQLKKKISQVQQERKGDYDSSSSASERKLKVNGERNTITRNGSEPQILNEDTFAGLKRDIAIIKKGQERVDNTITEVIYNLQTVTTGLEKISKKVVRMERHSQEQDKTISRLRNHIMSLSNGKIEGEDVMDRLNNTLTVGMGNKSHNWYFPDKLYTCKKWTKVMEHEQIEITKNNFPIAFKFVSELFNLTSPEKWRVTKIIAVRNENLLQSPFERRVNKLDMRAAQSEFIASLDDEKDPELRMFIENRMEKFVCETTESGSKMFWGWHGTKSSAVNKICDSGFSALGTTDQGYFGNGIYTSFQVAYAGSVYAKDGILLLCNMSALNCLPVVRSDMFNLKGKNAYKNYDAHYIPVVPSSPDNDREKVYWGIEDVDMTPKYDEFVVFEEAQIIPRFIVHYSDS
mmetsp:Transcript_19071/g.21244  ORF Transcript_19071/g.21244 Transcript_19071/m.21244 type:complete len:607 (+) Transcript_19071:30-1850(+)